MAHKYEYPDIAKPSLKTLQDDITNSTMTDKGFEWTRWDEVVPDSGIGKLTICFTNELSASDKTKLDAIVNT